MLTDVVNAGTSDPLAVSVGTLASSKMFFNCVQVFDAVEDVELAVLSTDVSLDSAESTRPLTVVRALLMALACAVVYSALPAAKPTGAKSENGNPRSPSCLALIQFWALGAGV